jgi:predicted component of type VI protein secretion system
MPAILVPVNQGKAIVLDKPIVLVGRHPDCDAVILNSRKISRKHCAVALVNNRFLVRDLGSMNGVWVNGVRVESQSAVDFGDELMIGDVAFTLNADKAAAAKSKGASAAPIAAETPLAPAKSQRAPEAVAARSKPLARPKNLDLSMEFPVPIDDDDGEDDGFAVPPPKQKPLGGDTDVGDDFIPLKDE